MSSACESGQDTNTKLFWKSVAWKFDIEIPPLWIFRVVEG
jgi:hypothetical protein